MNNIFSTIFILLIFINSTFGQDLKPKEEFSVINILGANVYEKPTFNSKTLKILPPGEKVIIEEQIQSDEELQMGTGFSFAGKWIKPESVDGFIFSSDLTDKEVEIRTKKSGQTFINLRGTLTGEETKEKQTETPMGKFPKYFKYKYYENGSYTYIEWDGCFNHIYEYQNLSISEVFHQMVSDYSALRNGNALSIPSFSEKADNIIKFEVEEATQDLQIELKGKGIFKVSSYDCT